MGQPVQLPSRGSEVGTPCLSASAPTSLLMHRRVTVLFLKIPFPPVADTTQARLDFSKAIVLDDHDAQADGAEAIAEPHEKERPDLCGIDVNPKIDEIAEKQITANR